MAGSVSIRFSAQTQEFRDALKKAKDSLKEFGASDKDVQRLNSQLNQFSGSKLIDQAEKMAYAIKGIGGAGTLTANELRRTQGVFAEYAEKAHKMGVSVSADVQQVLDDVARLHTASSKPVSLGVDTASVSKSTSGMAMLTGAVGGFVAGITSQALPALQDMAVKALETGGKIADLAAKTGLTTTEIQRLEYAAKMSGSSVDTITNSVTQLSNRLVDGNSGTVNALAKLGLNLQDLQNQSPGKTFEDVAEALRGIEDPMVQTNLAMELFGKSGAEILPAIKAGIKEAGDAARDLGLILDEDAVAALDNMGDKWDTFVSQVELGAARAVSDIGTIIDALVTLKNQMPGGSSIGFVDAATLGANRVAGWATQTTVKNAKQVQAVFGTPDLKDPSSPLQAASAPRTTFSEKDLDFAQRQTDRAIADLQRNIAKAQAERAKIDADRKRFQTEANKASGQSLVTESQHLLKVIAQVGAAKVVPSELPKFIATLTEGRTAAQRLDQDYKDIEKTLTALYTSPAGRAFFQQGIKNPTIGLAGATNAMVGGVNTSNVGQFYRPMPGAVTPNFGLPAITAAGGARQQYSSTLAGQFTDDAMLFGSLKKADTDKWTKVTKGLGDLSDAIGVLGQISGGALDKLTRAMGVAATSGGAGVSLVGSLGSLFAGSGWLGRNGRLGSGLAGAIGGGMAGWDFGSQAGSRTSAALGGAASGAMAGLGAGAAIATTVGGGAAAGAATGSAVMPIIGTLIGAAAGAIMGYVAKRRQEKKQYDLKDKAMGQIEAEFGGLDNILTTLGRLGKSQPQAESWLKKWYGDPKEFDKAITELQTELKKEEQHAEKLAKAFEKAANARRRLNREEITDIAKTKGVGQGGPQDAVLEEFLTGKTSKLQEDLQRWLDSGPSTATAATAGASGLAATFTLLKEQGLSTRDALKEMNPLIDSYREKIVLAGKGSNPFFDQIGQWQAIMNDDTFGPLIEGADAATQVMATLADVGMITQESFDSFGDSVDAAFEKLAAEKGSDTAYALLHDDLQQLWELSQDYGLTLDDNTKKIVDAAAAEGRVGDQHRDQTDKMATAIQNLVDRLGELADRWDAVGDAAAKAGDRFPSGPEGVGGDYDSDGTPDRTNAPGFRRGTKGLREFGKGTLAVLHGKEAVVPENEWLAMQEQIKHGELANAVLQEGAVSDSLTGRTPGEDFAARAIEQAIKDAEAVKDSLAASEGVAAGDMFKELVATRTPVDPNAIKDSLAAASGTLSGDMLKALGEKSKVVEGAVKDSLMSGAVGGALSGGISGRIDIPSLPQGFTSSQDTNQTIVVQLNGEPIVRHVVKNAGKMVTLYAN